MAVTIKWSKNAVEQLDQIISYIEQDSPINAYKIKDKILQKIDALSKQPEKYAPDKYKIAMMAVSERLNYSGYAYHTSIRSPKSGFSGCVIRK